MYQRPNHSDRIYQTLRAAGSLYYDYTEGFESEFTQRTDNAMPLCPIPQRAGSVRRPMVLRDDSEVQLGTTGIALEHEAEGKERHDSKW